MSEVTDLLSPGRISLDATATDWRDAISQAGRLLELEHACTEEYTRSMIANVEEKGPYIVVAPGFAFAHARPSEAVRRTAMSWLRLQTPVPFGSPKNDPVSLVVALAATDAKTHLSAMKGLARVLANHDQREALEQADSEQQILDILERETHQAPTSPEGRSKPENASTAQDGPNPQDRGTGTAPKNKILTVCGNGLGTSLFLKNTLEQVLSHWGWAPFITVEATDTISAKGKAKEADLILTSSEISKTLGDLGIPVKVIENFTSSSEIDRALRDSYDI